MRFVTYRATDGDARVGTVDSEGWVRPTDADDLLEVIRDGAEPAPTAEVIGAVDEVELLAPIPRPPRNVFCIGKNYVEHAREFSASGYDRSGAASDDQQPAAPIVFSKPPSSVIGTGAAIEPHSHVTAELDYEAELGVIIGPGGRDISEADAAHHVWGYTIVNDVTARDRQREHKQWLLGKGLDTFCPMGPFAVTAEEIDPDGFARPELDVSCWVNGELRQKATTLELIFDIPRLIATISAGLSLEPGDIIATGTPAGVGIGFTPPRFLQPGDRVEITITGLGTLQNTVGGPTPPGKERDEHQR